MMYVHTRARKIYFGGACEPPYKIVFQPEKRGLAPSIDVEHQEFVKCLRNSFKENHLDQRIRRGRPIT
eukprot:264493-Prymnesium_polylepis.1